MNIVEKLEQELDGRVDIPPADPKKIWLRFPCPFCGGNRAAVSHQLEWFTCYRCQREITVYSGNPGELVVNRFARQIARAVRRVKYAYGRWVESDQLESTARWFVFNYATGKEKINDGGMLADWEADFEGEPWRLDGKVQTALDRDLMNWAESEKRWKEKTRSAGDFSGDRADSHADTRSVSKGGTMRVRRRGRQYFRSSIPKGARLDRVYDPPRRDGRNMTPVNLGKLQRCELMRDGLGPIPGHCRWCNRAIADEAVSAYDRKYHNGKLDLADLEDISGEIPELTGDAWLSDVRPEDSGKRAATIQQDSAGTKADMTLVS